MAYFHAKSRIRHTEGKAMIVSQNLGLVMMIGNVLTYSVLKFSLGATKAYMGRKMNQIAILPGMAMTVYLVQILVIKAAFASTVTRPAVYMAVPHTQ